MKKPIWSLVIGSWFAFLAIGSVAFAADDFGPVLKMHGRTYSLPDESACYVQATVRANPVRLTLTHYSFPLSQCRDAGQSSMYSCFSTGTSVVCDSTLGNEYAAITIVNGSGESVEAFYFQKQDQFGRVVSGANYFSVSVPVVQDCNMRYCKGHFVLFKTDAGETFPARASTILSDGTSYFEGFRASSPWEYFLEPPGATFKVNWEVPVTDLPINVNRYKGWSRKHGIRISRAQGDCYGRIEYFYENYAMVKTIQAGSCADGLYFLRRYRDLRAW
jgi:hypothetical protein